MELRLRATLEPLDNQKSLGLRQGQMRANRLDDGIT